MAIFKSRAVRVVLIVIGVLVVTLGGLVASVLIPFSSYAPVTDGAELPGGAVLVQDGNANVYILPTGPANVALIDCGMDPEMKAVDAALQARGMALASVNAVFITHGHPDHIGGCKALPNATLYAQTREVAAIEGSEVIPGFMSTMTFAKPTPSGLKVTGLADEQIVQVGNLSVTAYALAGHTPGSGAYLVNDVLYIGDTAGITKDGKTAAAPWIFNTDGDQAAASLKALAARLVDKNIKVETVATGHSGPGPFSALQ